MAMGNSPPSPAETSAQPTAPGGPPPPRPRSRGLAGGLVLIAIGVLFLIQQLAAPNWSWDVLWPVLLIVAGIAIGAAPLLSRQPLNYSRTFWAVALIAVGALFLVANLGYLNGWDGERLVQLWPLLLILVGAEILITRSRLPRQTAAILGALVAIVAVLGAALYVGLGPATSAASVGSDASAEIGDLQQATLDLSVGGATVTIHNDAPAGQLYRAHFQLNNGERTRANLNQSNGVLSIEVQSRPFVFGPARGRTVDVSLSGQVPWSISINGGATQQTLDFSKLKLTRVSINGGAEQITMILPAPSGTVPIQVNGGAANVTIHRPAGTEASLTMSGGVNDFTADGQHESSLAGETHWQSSGYAGTTNHYDVQVSGGANHVTIDTQ
jgi:cell wall-active antibiotic response 4TMS protein YvqF